MSKALSGVVLGAAMLSLGLTGCSPQPSQSSATPSPSPSPPAVVPSPSPTVSILGDVQVPFDEGDYMYYIGGPGEWARDGAQGSGCTPPSGDTLPDGVWFGYVTQWDSQEIGFDLACNNSSNDFGGDSQITNDNSKIRVLPVDPGAQYSLGRDRWHLGYGRFAFSWTNVVAAKDTIGLPQTTSAVWLYVNGGAVTQVAAWDLDLDRLREGLPWVPWGPELEPYRTSDFPFAPAEPRDWAGATDYFPSLYDETAADGAIASGCSPPAGEALPDGEWYGYTVDISEDAMVFDLVCQWPSGSPEAEEISAQCDEEVNGCYPWTTNDSAQLYTIPIAPDAQYLWQQSEHLAYSARRILALPEECQPWGAPGGGFSAWVYVNDGMVTAYHRNWQS